MRRCATCQLNQNKPAAAPVHAWEFPSTPWERIHIDHAGPTNGNTFLVVVNSYSKWVEVERVKYTDARTTCAVLRKIFATHGLPKVVVSDNGPGFASEEFNTFLKRNGVRHLYSAPYHPSSNGQAERFVRIFKEALKTLKEGDVDMKLSRFLFRYRITPQTTTGQSPSELLFRRKVRSALSLLRPDISANVRKSQEGKLSNAGRFLQAGTEVLVENFHGMPKWIPGVIADVRGSSNYTVRLEDGQCVHRHIDQIVRHHRVGAEPPQEAQDVFMRVPDEVVTESRPTAETAEPVVEAMQEQPVAVRDRGSTGSNLAEQTAAEVAPTVVEGVAAAVAGAEAGKTPLERRAPSGRVRRPPGWLANYEV